VTRKEEEYNKLDNDTEKLTKAIEAEARET
jgi:hypothetical protein